MKTIWGKDGIDFNQTMKQFSRLAFGKHIDYCANFIIYDYYRRLSFLKIFLVSAIHVLTIRNQCIYTIE